MDSTRSTCPKHVTHEWIPILALNQEMLKELVVLTCIATLWPHSIIGLVMIIGKLFNISFMFNICICKNVQKCYQVQQTTGKSHRVQWLKCCEYNN